MIVVILWVVAGILWTVVVSVLSYLSGVAQEKERQKDEAQSSPSTFYQTLQSPAFAKEDLDALNERIGLVDQKVQRLTQQESPGRLSSGTLRRLEQIEPLLDRVSQLESRDRSYQERFRRVEKKAGLSV